MSASRQALGGITAALVMLLTFSAREAAASGGAQWYVETVGDECAPQRNAFEREITLACEAVGGTCRVASTPKEAELRAVIDCSNLEDSWTLVTRTIDGTVLASLDLSGPRSDRLRQAAVEVARDAAPERSLAAESLRFSLAKEAPSRTTQRPLEKVSLMLGGRTSAVSDATAPTLFGAHLLGGLVIMKHVRTTLGIAGDGGGSGRSAMRAVRGGGGLAFGAPFEASTLFGIAFEAGVSSSSRYANASSAGLLATDTLTTGYGQGTLVLQWPHWTVRPFTALSATVFTGGPPVMASAEAGLAFAIF
jgi:hypothetical protein